MNKIVKSSDLAARSAPGPDSRHTSGLAYRIGRTYRFESAHHLPHLPDGHKCKNLHGHNYRVEIVVRGTLDARGFVKDFAEIDAELSPLVKMVDHKLLNDIEGLENPTAEVIAAWFFARIPDCESVRVYENDECWAEVREIELGRKPPQVTQLGRQTELPDHPDKALLERVANPHADTAYVARFTAPEFTSLCPVTGQPDFAHLVIDYVPDGWLVESKSLKLYLAAFRNHGAFHEDCTVAIGKRLAGLLEPHFLRIGGYWYPRGGMPIDVFWQTGTLPSGVWLPDQGVAPYRGRG